MVKVDFCRHHRPRTQALPEEDKFKLAAEIARSHPEVTLRLPVGDHADETIEVEGEVLARDGVAVF